VLLSRGPHFAAMDPGSAEQRFRTMLRIAWAAPRPGHAIATIALSDVALSERPLSA